MSSNEKKLKSVLNEMINDMNIGSKLMEVRLREEWEAIVGKMIAGHTQSVDLKGDILTLKVESSALRHQLLMSKGDLIAKINEHLENPVVRDVKLR